MHFLFVALTNLVRYYICQSRAELFGGVVHLFVSLLLFSLRGLPNHPLCKNAHFGPFLPHFSPPPAHSGRGGASRRCARVSLKQEPSLVINCAPNPFAPPRNAGNCFTAAVRQAMASMKPPERSARRFGLIYPPWQLTARPQRPDGAATPKVSTFRGR